MTTNDLRAVSVIHRLVERARREPDAPLLRFYDGRGRLQASLTQAEAVAAMRSMSGFLTSRCKLGPGDTALLVYPPSLDFAVALLGCMHAGIVPAPVYPPHPFKLEQGLETFEPISRNCGARVALTNRLYARSRRLGRVRSFVSGRESTGRDLEWIATDKVKPGQFDAAPGPAVGPDDVALLQYTSGSTSAPKGVMITHGNLIHQLDFNREQLRMGPDSRMVSWVPQYHDFGLISGILSVTAGNGEFTMFSPLDFIEKPSLWFELITRHRATHIAAPDFAYALSVRKTPPEQRAGYDLSHVIVAMSAAEPVRATTVDRFAEAFAVSGFDAAAFNPAYGLAEHTVGVTVSGKGRVRVDRAALEQGRVEVAAPDADGLTLMGCGRPAGDIAVAIVDPEREVRLPAGRVGEVWCDSPSKAAGYLGQPELSRTTFEARIADAPAHGWLRTGDMGFLHEGELYICGRLKDMIILQGRNLYAQDVEDAARTAHALIRPGGLAAFVQEHIGEDAPEGLVLFVEIEGGQPSPDAVRAVVAAVQKAVRTTCDVGCQTIVLGGRGLVRKTTSGKVRRRACRRAFEEGDRTAVWHVQRFEAQVSPGRAPSVAPAAIAGETESLADAIRRVAAELLDLPGPEAIDPVEPLFGQGLSSVAAVDLCGEMAEIVGHPVPVALLFQNPSVERLARALSGDEAFEPDAFEAADPFVELHQGDRVIVVGGGPTGITAARALIDKGLAVHLLDSEAEVGGKVVDVEFDGKRYELGQILFFTGYTHTLARISELDLPLAPGRLNNHVLTADGQVTPIAVDETVEWAERVLDTIGERPDQAAGLEDIPPELTVPLPEWLASHGLPPMPPGIGDLWTGFGYGTLDDSVPMFYFATILNVLVKNGIHVATLSGRNMDLWQAEVDRLLEGDRFSLELGVRATAIEEATVSTPARVRLADGRTLEADAVVLAVPPSIAGELLPSTHPAVPLLARFRTFQYVVTVADIDAPDWPEHAVMPHNLSGARRGHMMDFQRPYGADGLFVLSQYGREQDGSVIDDETLTARLKADIEGAGCTLRDIRLRRRWTYFPHLSSDDLRAGVLDDLRSSQGRGDIVLAGSYFGMETLEHTLSGAERLIRTRVAVRSGPSIEDVLRDPVFGEPARVARDAEAPLGELAFGDWIVRPATMADDAEVDRLDREEYGWLGEDAVEGIESIRHQIALLNGGPVPYLWVIERDGRLMGWYVLLPTSVDPKSFSTWAEVTDSGRLTGTFDPDGRHLYLVAAGVASGLPRSAHDFLILASLRVVRARQMALLFICLAMPGFASTHAATGIEPEDYMLLVDGNGVPQDPLMAFVRTHWPGEHRPPRFLRDGYPPDQFSGGHGVSTVIDMPDPAGGIDTVLLRLMRRREELDL